MAATTLPNPELDGLGEGDYERIGEKVTHRLAQRPWQLCDSQHATLIA